MKKKILFLISMSLLLSVFVACNNKEEVKSKDEDITTTEIDNIKEEAQVDKSENEIDENSVLKTYYTKETLPNYEEKANEVIITEDSVIFVDGVGEEKTIKKNPEKVVGLYPSHIVLWYEAGGDLIGRITTKTSEGNMPEEAKNIEIVGEGTSPDKFSLEKIMSIEPEIVFLGIGSQTEMVDKFKELNVEPIVIDNETLADYLKWVKVISNIYEKPEIYDEALENVLEPVNEILLKVPAENNPKILMMQGNDKGNLVAYLPKTTAAGIVDDLKGENIVVNLTYEQYDPTNGIDKVELSFETLLENQPEIILLKHSAVDKGFNVRAMVSESLASNSVWTSLDAVKEDNIYSLPEDYFHYKPTKEYPKAYEYIAKILYPEIFGEQVKDDVKE